MSISSNRILLKEAFDVIYSPVTDDLTATGTTDIVNVTEAGLLLAITFGVTVGITGSITSNIEIVVDGGATRTIPGYSGNTWNPAGMGIWQLGERTIQGLAVDDHGVITIGSRYATSLRVSHNISVGGSAGTIRFGVLRGKVL